MERKSKRGRNFDVVRTVGTLFLPDIFINVLENSHNASWEGLSLTFVFLWREQGCKQKGKCPWFPGEYSQIPNRQISTKRQQSLQAGGRRQGLERYKEHVIIAGGCMMTTIAHRANPAHFFSMWWTSLICTDDNIITDNSNSDDNNTVWYKTSMLLLI